MSGIITLGGSGNSYNISTPQYGYSCEIFNSIHFQRKKPFGYATFDDGSAYDYRVFTGSFMLDVNDADEFINLYRDLDKGRGVTIGMRLPKNSGFTPFGPDKGDYGNYTVTMYNFEPSGALVAPYKHFIIRCSMSALSFPSVTEPEYKSDGSFSIGSITGLRFPVNFPQPVPDYDLDVRITRNGTGKYLDKLPTNDHYETTLKMICSRSRAYALIDYLFGTVRTSAFNTTTSNGTYLFGIENGSGDTYSCQWIDNSIVMRHVSFDRYEFDINICLIEVI